MVETNRRAMTPQDITRIRFISEPQMAPNGKSLAFLSERESGRKPQLYVMPDNGGEPIRLTDLPNGVADPVWSPDSTRLAFTSWVGGEPEPKSQEDRHLSKPARVIATMKYKANGDGFIYDRRPHIFVVSVNGDSPCQQITDGEWADTDPTWSADGQCIAFVSARHADRDDDNAADIWVIPPDGGSPRQLTDTAGPLSLPVFSPDGHTIAYLGHRYKHDSGRNTRLYTVPVAGGLSVCVTANFDRTCAPFFGRTRPLWSPEGRWIYFLHAPLTYTKDMRTPLLIIHSEDDLRCPIEQAEQLFIALKKQRKEVLFVRFPDENHELSRSGRPRHRLERFRYILEWFAKYV